MTDRPAFPLPVPTPDNQPYWDALDEGRLVIQHCADCDAQLYPPRPMCPACASFRMEWRDASGRGAVYSYVVTHQAIHPSFEGHLPCVTVAVQLEEGPVMASNLVGVAPDEVAIGMPVQVTFERVSEEITLPLFRRV